MENFTTFQSQEKCQLENNSACWALEMRFQQKRVPQSTQEKSAAQEPGIDWGLSPPCPHSSFICRISCHWKPNYSVIKIHLSASWKALKNVLLKDSSVHICLGGEPDLLKVLMLCCTLSWSRILANPDISAHLDQSLYSSRGHGVTLLVPVFLWGWLRKLFIKMKCFLFLFSFWSTFCIVSFQPQHIQDFLFLLCIPLLKPSR